MRVLITGASSGIGRALAHLYGGRRATLILLGRDEGRLKEVAQEVGSACTATHALDLSTRGGREQFCHLLDQEVPDLLIQSAGLGRYGDVVELSGEEQEAEWAVNVEALVAGTRTQARALIRHAKRGKIVNISSAAGELPTPGMALYGASKAFVSHFSRAMDEEVRPYGVRVLTHAPGQVDTPFALRAGAKAFARDAWTLSPERVARAIARQVECERSYWIYDWRVRLQVAVGRLMPTLAGKMIYRRLRQRMGQSIFPIRYR